MSTVSNKVKFSFKKKQNFNEYKYKNKKGLAIKNKINGKEQRYCILKRMQYVEKKGQKKERIRRMHCYTSVHPNQFNCEMARETALIEITTYSPR